MKQLLATILLSALFWTCGNNRQNAPQVLELSDAKTINIKLGSPRVICADQAKNIGIEEMLAMTSSIDYIKLDSSEPIGDQIDKMIITKDKILILDSFITQQIFVFDKTGKLLFRIKNKGRGPNEYLSAWDMQVDTIRNEILLNDPIGHSYIYFSADNGKFLRREEGVANCYLSRIDSLYVNLTVNGQDFNEEENWSILVTDKDSVTYKGFELLPIQEGDYIVNSFTYDYDGGLLYTPIYSDTVYQFKSPSSAFAKYVIQQEKSIWTLNDQWLNPLEINKRIKENNYTRYSGRFLATENHAAFEIGHAKDGRILAKPYFWDKRTDAVYAWDTSLDAEKRPIVRDLIRQPIAVYGNTFYSTFSPAIPEEYRKDLNPKLKKMLDDSEDGDNPIVVMYKLK